MRIKKQNIDIRHIAQEDIPGIVAVFDHYEWPKPYTTFEKYLTEQQQQKRLVWLAYQDNDLLGYVTLKWRSEYHYFIDNNIPEISDLNVLPPYRKQRIASILLDIAEEKAFRRSDKVGIGVGLYTDYGAAQQLYIKRGYHPDGQGISYAYRTVKPGEIVKLDDDLILWFVKYALLHNRGKR